MPQQTQHDSNGNSYVEINLIADQRIRVTNVPNGWTGGEVMRVQIRDENGHLRQGPDIPIENVGEVFQAVVHLARR